MPTSPTTVTLTATLNSITGAAVTSSAKLRITLCNFTGQIPRVSGQSLFGEVKQEQVFTGADLSFPVVPNDLIAPGGTFYCVQVFNAAGDCIEANNYLILSRNGGAQNLASLPIFDPYAVTLMGAVPNGIYPGRVYQLPLPATHGVTAVLWYNGALQGPMDFEVSGLSLLLNFETVSDDTLYVRYPVRGLSGDAYTSFVAVANGQRPGRVFTIPTAPPGAQFAGVYVNGTLQLPGTYVIAAGTLALNDPLDSARDRVYLLYVTSSYNVQGEIPQGLVPGNQYTLSAEPAAVVGIFSDQKFLRPGIDYTLDGASLTLTNLTTDGGSIYAYFLA